MLCVILEDGVIFGIRISGKELELDLELRLKGQVFRGVNKNLENTSNNAKKNQKLKNSTKERYLSLSSCLILLPC